jgi:hypothetical protein
VHIPPGSRAGGRLSEAELLRGAGLILSYLLAFAQERDQAKSSAGESAADLAAVVGRP